MPARRLQPVIARYGLAAASVVAAAGLTHMLRGVGDSGISPLFFAAVLLSAWYGGLGPGIAATILSSLAIPAILSPDRWHTFSFIGDHILRLIVFGLVSVITSSLHGALRQAAEESRNARNAAEAASEAKSRFIAMVSHELRTPLNPVLMLTQMLERDPSLTPGLRDDIRTIRRNVDLEIRLIDDLVDLTRISAGKMQLRPAIIDLNEPLKAAIEVCRDDIGEKQLELVTDFKAGDSLVNGDAVRLQQVFWNLIRNAVKFTPERGIIRISSHNDNVGSIAVTVSDSGIGIDPMRLSIIFQAFEQGEPDIQIRFGGLGLGLAICQAMVEAHHGDIDAVSAGKGHGATFKVTLPTIKPAEAGLHERDELSPVRNPGTAG
jgi:signal transduction histidine kinase